MVHGALIFDSILPTRSKSRHAFFLQIYGSGSGPLEASDDGVALGIFNDDGDGVQWHSGSKDSSGGDGVGGGPPPIDESARESPVRWLDGSVVARHCQLGFG
jgi:hypothetical protein